MINQDLNINKLAKAYFVVKKYVIESGYSNEIDWQNSIEFKEISAQYFLQEYTWVVLSSGMSEKVIAKIFPVINDIFKKWEDLEYIVNHKDIINRKSLSVFNNKSKIRAIIDTSIFIYQNEFSWIMDRIRNENVNYLISFPFIGKATCYHLAKNLGLTFAKPDRHLVRISQRIGFKTPEELCTYLSAYISEKVQVIDLVLWRYATLDKNYLVKLNQLIAN
jgi:endonuclease III